MIHPALETHTAPTVSFCVHVRNRLQFLIPCLNSILNQTCPVFELVVLDFGCSENSADYVRSNYQDDRIKVFEYPDSFEPWTMAASKNLAIANATGQIVVIVDCDNIFDPDFLACHLNLYKTDRQSFYFGGAQHPSHDTVLPFGLTMLWREDFIQVGGFNEVCTYGWGREDVDFVARLCKLGLECKGFLNLVHSLKHSDQIRNREARTKSIIETNNLNFIASSIGFKDYQGNAVFSPEFIEALHKTEEFSDRPIQLTSFEDVTLIFHEYIYNKTYLDRSIRCFLYSLKLNYECENRSLSTILYAYSKVNDKAGSNYRRDPKDYLSFEWVFTQASFGNKQKEGEYILLKNTLHKEIISRSFYRTVWVLEKVMPEVLEEYLINNSIKKNKSDIIERFSGYVIQALGTVVSEYTEYISDVFFIEKTVFEVEKTAAVIDEPLEIEINKLKNKIAALDKGSFGNVELILSPAVKIGRTKWDWRLGFEDQWEKNFHEQPASYPFLINSYNSTVVGDTILPLKYQVYMAFEEANSVKNALYQFLPNGITNLQQDVIIQQIKEAFDNNILITTSAIQKYQSWTSSVRSSTDAPLITV